MRLHLLGTARLIGSNGQSVALERKGAALLALLAIEGTVPRERVAALVWCEADRAHARSSLRQRLHRLNKAAGRLVDEAQGALALAPDVEHDLVDPASRIEADPSAGEGVLLGGFDYGDSEELALWIAAQRRRWQTARLQALADVASRLERSHRIDRAIDYARALVAAEPINEHPQRRLMRLHYMRGDRAAAIAVFDSLTQVLGRELGLRPGIETNELARLIERSGALPEPAPHAPPLALVRPPVLVGRAAAWHELDRLRQDRCVALVSGEPGIGKSRLLGAYAEAHPGSAVVDARPDDQHLPYALLARLIRTMVARHGAPTESAVIDELALLVPELGAPSPALRSHQRLRPALAQALRFWSERGARMIVVDDLQYADAASLESLLAVSAEEDSTVVWLLGVRAAEMPELLCAWLDERGDEGVSRIGLQPLGDTDARAFVASLEIPGLDAAAWSEPLVRHTGGNPLFMLETLRALLTVDSRWLAQPPLRLPTPESVGRLIERRLQQLSAAAIRLARVAAIAGTAFDVDLAARVLETRPIDIADAWRELETAQVIRGQAFAHDLIHEAATRSVPEPIARVLHACVAAHLEALGAAATTVAQHWHAAHDWARAGPHFRRAADDARLASRRKEEADALALAADCFAKADEPQQRFEALEQRFEATRYVEQFKVSQQIADELVAQATTPLQRMRALDSKARVLAELYEYVPALRAAREAVALAHQHDLRSELPALLQTESRMLAALERHDEALAILERQAAATRDDPQAPASPAFLVMLGKRLCTSNRPGESAAVLERAVSLAHAQQNWTALYDALVALADPLFLLGRVALAASAIERARGLLGRLGAERPPTALSEISLGRMYRILGRFSDAHSHLEGVIERMRDAGNHMLLTVAINDLVQVYSVIGQTARAHQTLATHVHPLPDKARGNQRAALAYLLAAEGKAAADAFRTLMADIPNDGLMDYYLLRFTPGLCAQVAPGEAEALARHGIAKAEALQQHINLWPLKVALIEALNRDARAHEAAPVALELLERFSAEPSLCWYPAEMWHRSYECLNAAGNRLAAREALARGLRWINEVGLANLPAAWHDGFKHRQLTNVALIAAAAREGVA